ncbi:MAG: D-alanyl-D-alanine carboxypeptidase family protein [Chthoniobacterales bacterium]
MKLSIRIPHPAIIASLALVLFPQFARTAESFIIVDSQTGYILGSKNPDDKRQVASLTKVATALVVLDWAKLTTADLNELVSVPATAAEVGGVNQTGLMAGDTVSMRDLLYAALMASDNVSAETLAHHVGRRLPNPNGLSASVNFVSHMNGLAYELGMKRTKFTNPSGLDNLPKNLPHSTAADMARLTRYAYSQSAFAFYVAQKKREIHIFRAGQTVNVWLTNTNSLLGEDDIDGVKTGRTSKAGDCIILSADKSPETKQEGENVLITPRRIIVVLLASPDRAAEGLSTMRQGWGLYDAWATGGRKMQKSRLL